MMITRSHKKPADRTPFRGIGVSSCRGKQGGFTLMEIMVVVIIIGIMFAVTLPTLRSTAENNRLRSSVRELTSLMKYARTEAVFSARTTEVFLDTKKNQYWMDLRTPDKKTGKYNPKKSKKSSMERKRDLEKQVWFKGINADTPNILDKGVIACDFYPDGTASPILITLQNHRDTLYTIEVLKSTGLVKLNHGDLEEVQDSMGSRDYPLPDDYYKGYSATEAVR